MLFGDYSPIKLVLIACFFLQQRILRRSLKIRKSPLEAPRLPAVEPGRAAREGRKKTPVMADDHERGASRIEIPLQPFDRRQIEMIGRLIKQKDVGIGRQYAGEGGPARLAAGKMCRIFPSVEAETFEETPDGVQIAAALPEARLHIGKRRSKA